MNRRPTAARAQPSCIDIAAMELRGVATSGLGTPSSRPGTPNSNNSGLGAFGGPLPRMLVPLERRAPSGTAVEPTLADTAAGQSAPDLEHQLATHFVEALDEQRSVSLSSSAVYFPCVIVCPNPSFKHPSGTFAFPSMTGVRHQVEVQTFTR